MRRQSIRNAAAAALLLLTTAGAEAQETPPTPVNGVSFEEWTAGNARLADNRPLEEVLSILEIDEAQWNEAGETFMKVLSEGDPAFITRYGEIFADPAVGRFADRDDNPKATGKLAAYEDYARVQAHLTVAAEAGVDPQQVLAEHDLSVYEFSQESGDWIRQMGEAVQDGRIVEWNGIREDFEAEYRERYGLDPVEPETE
ncbi:MAG: DUF6620 family protein [Pikeienuella sp.]